MVVGDYTFVLKVTDKGGQTASSSVTVVVQREKNAPSVAVAGSDKVNMGTLCLLIKMMLKKWSLNCAIKLIFLSISLKK